MNEAQRAELSEVRALSEAIRASNHGLGGTRWRPRGYPAV